MSDESRNVLDFYLSTRREGHTRTLGQAVARLLIDSASTRGPDQIIVWVWSMDDVRQLTEYIIIELHKLGAKGIEHILRRVKFLSARTSRSEGIRAPALADNRVLMELCDEIARANTAAKHKQDVIEHQDRMYKLATAEWRSAYQVLLDANFKLHGRIYELTADLVNKDVEIDVLRGQLDEEGLIP